MLLADRGTTRTVNTASGLTTTSRTWIACCASSRPHGSTCRSPRSWTTSVPNIGIIGYGTSHWAIEESRGQLEREFGVRTGYGFGAYPFTQELDPVHRSLRTDLPGRAEPRRADARPDAPLLHAGAGSEAAKRAALRLTDRCPIGDRRHRGTGRPEGPAEQRRAGLGGTMGAPEHHDYHRNTGTGKEAQSHRTRRSSLTAAARPRCARGAGTTPFQSASSMRSSRWGSIRRA